MATVDVEIRYRGHHPTVCYSQNGFEKFDKIGFPQQSVDFMTPLASLDPVNINSPPESPDPVGKQYDRSAGSVYKLDETESTRCVITSSSAALSATLSRSNEMDEENSASTTAVTTNESTDADSAHKTPSKQFELIVYEFNFRQLLIVAMSAPFLSMMAAFLIGFSIDYEYLLNYEWTCGRVLLPSFSRIINLPKERIMWNIFVLSHTTLRPFMVFVNHRICSKTASPVRFPLLHSILVQFIPIFGFIEVLFLILLTVIGEREGPG